MVRIRATDVVITGAASLTVAPGASIEPARWAGKPARLSRMDRLCGLALVACDGALVDGGLAPTAPEWNGERTAIVLGTAYGCHATNEDYYRGLVREGAAGASPRLFAYTLPSSPVGEVSIHYGVRGPTLVVANGLASGLDALAEGVALVAEGRADRALVCAAEVATPLLAALLGGAALVDAAAALVVERASDASARGATPRGRLAGACAAFGAAALKDAIDAALAGADVPAGGIARLIAAPADAAIARAAGVTAAAIDVPGALGAASLVALAREPGALTLACASDDGGAASAVVVTA